MLAIGACLNHKSKVNSILVRGADLYHLRKKLVLYVAVNSAHGFGSLFMAYGLGSLLSQ